MFLNPKSSIMKKMLLLIFALSFTISVSAQQKTSDDLLAKSKRKKNTGWILLGGGAGLLIIGAAVNNSANSSLEESFKGLVPITAGFFSVVTSVPFFLKAGKLKRQAKAMAFSGFNNIDITGIGKITQPAVGISINF